MNPANPVDQQMDESPAQADESSFGDILKEFEQQQPAPAETARTESGVINGKIIALTGEWVFVDIGSKAEAVLPVSDLPDGLHEVKAGDPIQVTIKGRTEEGQTLLSLLKIERPKDWSGLQAAFDEKRTIEGKVLEIVKGGLRVDIGARAFMPASRSGTRDAIELQKLVGTDIQCRIINLDIEKEDVVVDRRVILEAEAAQKKEEAFAALREGDVVVGRVRSVTDFGAFLDLGGIDGLLHVTDMSWNRVGKPSDLLKIGDEFEVKVLKVNQNTRKVSLGVKQLTPDPWTQVAEKYAVGDRIQGAVARLTDFGAFVELEPGVDGLVHVSQMSWSKKARKPSDLVNVGDRVEVVILGVKPAEKRIELGLKQALGDPFEEAHTRFQPGTIVEAPVTSIQNFGAFVDLGDGVEGMIHVGDLSNEKRVDHPKDVLKTGETVRAVVLEIDGERRRIRLGMKQLQPTKADLFIAEHQTGETLSGRIVDVRGDFARVEVAEGVLGECKLAEEKSEQPKDKPAAEQVDVGTLSAMLKARWKEGKGGEPAPKSTSWKPGQIRSFKIAALDAAAKKITLELIG